MPNAGRVIYLESWPAAVRSSAWWSLAITGISSLVAPAPPQARLQLFAVAVLVFTTVSRLVSRVRITREGAVFQPRIARRTLCPWPSAEAARVRHRADDQLVLMLGGNAIPVRLLLSDGIARFLPDELAAHLEAAVAEARTAATEDGAERTRGRG